MHLSVNSRKGFTICKFHSVFISRHLYLFSTLICLFVRVSSAKYTILVYSVSEANEVQDNLKFLHEGRAIYLVMQGSHVDVVLAVDESCILRVRSF